MLAILNERQITERQEELMELNEIAPEKFDHEFEFKLNNKVSDKKSETKYRTYTREEVQQLLEASRTPYEQPKTLEKSNYPILSREVVEKLVREHFEYKREQENKKKETVWDSLKTTELKTKTNTTTKPSRSTKGSKSSATLTKKS